MVNYRFQQEKNWQILVIGTRKSDFFALKLHYLLERYLGIMCLSVMKLVLTVNKSIIDFGYYIHLLVFNRSKFGGKRRGRDAAAMLCHVRIFL